MGEALILAPAEPTGETDDRRPAWTELPSDSELFDSPSEMRWLMSGFGLDEVQVRMVRLPA